MSELTDLERAIATHTRRIERAESDLRAAIMCVYRAKRPDQSPAYTLAEIAQVLGVTRQRVHQLVRELSARSAA